MGKSTAILGIFVFSAVAQAACLPPDGGTPTLSQYHDADQNADGKVTLSELLRVIQFYNSPGYHEDITSEDGFSPGDGARVGRPHDSDYDPADWHVTLNELLRAIQFYNLGGYAGPAASEDGFVPSAGLAPYRLPLPLDNADGDLLGDSADEPFLGTLPANPDSDGDGLPDGVLLAVQMAQCIATLPRCEGDVCPADAIAVLETPLPCTLPDPITGAPVQLATHVIVNPFLDYGIAPLHVPLPPGALYFLGLGSPGYYEATADAGTPCGWTWTTETQNQAPMRELYAALYSTPDSLPSSHLLPAPGDSDGDFLSDAEESALGMDQDDPDENDNEIPDGVERAQALYAQILALPEFDPLLPEGTLCRVDAFYEEDCEPVRVPLGEPASCTGAWHIVLAHDPEPEVLYVLNEGPLRFLAAGSFSYHRYEDPWILELIYAWYWMPTSVQRLPVLDLIALLEGAR